MPIIVRGAVRSGIALSASQLVVSSKATPRRRVKHPFCSPASAAATKSCGSYEDDGFLAHLKRSSRENGILGNFRVLHSAGLGGSYRKRDFTGGLQPVLPWQLVLKLYPVCFGYEVGHKNQFL
jgi:hypothetical protein